MNKLIFALLFSSVVLSGDQQYYGSTTAVVALAGSVIKTKHIQDSGIKYKRKDCPVCRGKGWYMSGDGILKIDCTYCEAEKGSMSIGTIKSITPIAPKISNPTTNCKNGQCKLPTNTRR